MAEPGNDFTAPANPLGLSATILRDESALASFLRTDRLLDEARITFHIRRSSESASAVHNPMMSAGSTSRRNSWPLGRDQPSSADNSLHVSASTTDLDCRFDIAPVTATRPKKRAMKSRLELGRAPMEEEISFVGAWAG